VTYIVSGIYKWRREDAGEIDKTQQQSAATVSKVSTEFGKTCHPNRLSDAHVTQIACPTRADIRFLDFAIAAVGRPQLEATTEAEGLAGWGRSALPAKWSPSV
jgi:hypothetical protein